MTVAIAAGLILGGVVALLAVVSILPALILNLAFRRGILHENDEG
ncbi:MAG: hypothetical protein ACLPWS_01505 [Rhodomicrobium sp.]